MKAGVLDAGRNVFLREGATDKDAVALGLEGEGLCGRELLLAATGALADGLAGEPLTPGACSETCEGGIGSGGSQIENDEYLAIALFAGEGQHIGSTRGERHPVDSDLVGESGDGMLQRCERADGIEHLGIRGRPIDFGVVEIVEGLIAAHLLSVIDEGHAIERVGEHGEGIAVETIFLREGLLRLVEVLVVVGDIEHTAERDIGRGVEHGVGISLERSGIDATTAKVGQAALIGPSIVVVEACRLQTGNILRNVAFAKEGNGLATLVVLDKGDGRLPVACRDA